LKSQVTTAGDNRLSLRIIDYSRSFF